MIRTAQDPVDQIIQSTFEFGRIMRQRMMGDGKDTTNFVQVHALIIVCEKPDITMKELACALHVTSPSATSLINRLVILQWIERRHDPTNRKLVRLRLTKDGANELRRKQRQRAEVIRELFTLLTVEEQKTLAALHEKLIRSYKLHPPHPHPSPHRP